MIEHIKNIIETIAILVCGGWVLFRFGLFRERYPSMQIKNGINYIGENDNEYLLELFCIVENKGKVRKWIAPLDFELLFLEEEDSFISNPEINEEVHFNKFLQQLTYYGNRKFWVQPTWYIPFVDGESNRQFVYAIAIPKNFKYLTLNTRFIDFNNKSKALKYILSQNSNKGSSSGKPWSEMSFNERTKEVGSKKTDFYYTQFYTSVYSIKNNSTQKLENVELSE